LRFSWGNALVGFHHPLTVALFVTLAGGLGGGGLASALDNESWCTSESAHNLGFWNLDTKWTLLVLRAPSSGEETTIAGWCCRHNTSHTLNLLGNLLWCLDVISVDWCWKWWTHHTLTMVLDESLPLATSLLVASAYVIDTSWH